MSRRSLSAWERSTLLAAAQGMPIIRTGAVTRLIKRGLMQEHGWIEVPDRCAARVYTCTKRGLKVKKILASMTSTT